MGGVLRASAGLACEFTHDSRGFGSTVSLRRSWRYFRLAPVGLLAPTRSMTKIPAITRQSRGCD